MIQNPLHDPPEPGVDERDGVVELGEVEQRFPKFLPILRFHQSKFIFMVKPTITEIERTEIARH